MVPITNVDGCLFAAYGCCHASAFYGGSESDHATCIWCSNAQFAAEAGEPSFLCLLVVFLTMIIQSGLW